MTSIIEKELICSICTDLLYEPVSFLDCLHTNCGACAKLWFASLSNNAAAKYTCPVCRAEVRATKHNPILQSLLLDFISQNPDKDRTPEEKVTLRKIYTPGKGVLPGEADTSPGLLSATPSVRRTPPRPPPSRNVPARPTPSRPVTVRPVTARPGPSSNRSAPPAPGYQADLTDRFWQSMNLNQGTSCFHCQERLDYALFCKCRQCDINTCFQCYRLDKGCRTPTPSAGHIHKYQKLRLEPTVHTQTGVFCDICETWCDNSRFDQGINSYFWSCSVCNNGNWDVCMPCISKGNCCTHELQLFTNNRASSRNASVRGNTSDPVRGRGDNRSSQLSAFGYVQWTNFKVTCDACKKSIPSDHVYLHCTACSNGQWDICMSCWEAVNAENYDDYDDSFGFPCRAGHKMLLVSQCGKEGSHKVLFDIPHDPPDFVSKTLSPAGQGWQRGVPEARNALAVKSHWPDSQYKFDMTVYRPDTPGERPWDSSGLLAFPEKATISNVWVAFTEGSGNESVEYLWGWYSGIGGLFPRDCVRFID